MGIPFTRPKQAPPAIEFVEAPTYDGVTGVDFSNLTPEQCAAIAACIDFSGLTTTQLTSLLQSFNFADLSPAQCSAIANCIDFAGLSPDQITALSQSIDFNQLTPAQITALQVIAPSGISADAGNILTLGSDQLPLLLVGSVSTAAAGAGGVTSTDAFGNPIGVLLPL